MGMILLEGIIALTTSYGSTHINEKKEGFRFHSLYYITFSFLYPSLNTTTALRAEEHETTGSAVYTGPAESPSYTKKRKFIETEIASSRIIS
jgi:hypothetical protein